jgi:hypothetical protein
MTRKQYIYEIVDRTCLPRIYKKKIVEDLMQEFDNLLAQGYSENDVMKNMGNPDDIASEIYENYISTEDVSRPFIEYKSSRMIFGMPLVHIVKGTRQEFVRASRNGRNSLRGVPTAKGFIAIGRRAKGIIAIGNFSCGVISLGNFSCGVISIANIGARFLSFGNLIFGILMALGNAAVGSFAVGNLAIGYSTVGNGGIGRYAIGHLAFGQQYLSVRNMYRGQQIQDFIDGIPILIQPFLHFGVSLVENWKWLLIILVIIATLIIITGIIVSNWLEVKFSK